MYGYDDDPDAQVDGDGSPFARSMNAQPWARAAMPPWHLWGNTVGPLDLTVQAGGDFGSVSTQQVVRVAYGRPETWQWLFRVKIIDAPAATGPLQRLDLQFGWDCVFGVGRSVQIINSFDLWTLSWTSADTPPRGRVLFATTTLGPPLGRFNSAGVVDPDPPPNLVSSFVAQDIQIQVRATIISGVVAAPVTATAHVEVGASVAPVHHARPDWFLLDAAKEAQFPGGETGQK